MPELTPGGSPDADFTFVASTATPLTGTYAGRITKTANNRQGNAIKLASIAVPLLYRGSCVGVSFGVGTSANYAAGDLVCYVKDETNGAWLTGDVSAIPSGTGFTFSINNVAIPLNCTSLALVVHVATVNALAWTCDVDEFSISPNQIFKTNAIGDWQNYSPTVANLGTGSGTVVGKWRRVGDSMELYIMFTKDGSSGTGSASVSFTTPAGLLSNYLEFQAAGQDVMFGHAFIFSVEASVQNATSSVRYYEGGGQGYLYIENLGGSGSMYQGQDFRAGCVATLMVRIPKIVGWSSNIQLANSRVEYASNSGMGDTNDTTSFVNDVNGSPFPTTSYSTDRDKTVRFKTPIQPTDSIVLQVKTDPLVGDWINAQPYIETGAGGAVAMGIGSGYGYGIVKALNSTDVVVRFFRYRFPPSYVWDGSVNAQWRVVKFANAVPVEVAGPVVARYVGSSSSFSTETVQNFATKVTDTHGAVTTGGSWKFTAPIAGFYDVKMHLEFSTAVYAVGNYVEAYLRKNGAQVSTLAQFTAQTTSGISIDIAGTDTIYLNQGDYIDISCITNRSGGLSPNGSAQYTYVSILRRG
jgi:hypothetical protein